MLCIPLGHAGALGSAQCLIRPLRVYSPGENRALFYWSDSIYEVFTRPELYLKIVSGRSSYLAQFPKLFLFGYSDIVV